MKGSSFAFAMQFLGSERRAALKRLHAFCQAADDAVDEAPDAEHATQALAFWQAQTDALYNEDAPGHAAAALKPYVKQYGLERAHFDMLLAGLAADCSRPVVVRSMQALDSYCDQVAGGPGLLALAVFGLKDDEQAQAFAILLGRALQYTNILRDVAEDAANNCCYVPLQLLQRHDVKAKTPMQLAPDAWATCCAMLGKRAQEYFAATHAYVTPANRSRLLPGLLMRDGYQRMLVRMLKDPEQLRTGVRARMNVGDKMRLALNALRYRCGV